MNIPMPAQLLLVFYICNFVLSAAVQSLAEPDTSSSKFYVFLYKFLSAIMADLKSYAKTTPPPEITVSKGAIVTTTTAAPAIGQNPTK